MRVPWLEINVNTKKIISCFNARRILGKEAIQFSRSFIYTAPIQRYFYRYQRTESSLVFNVQKRT